MKSPVRLFIDAPLVTGAGAPLDDAQSHYLRAVMRFEVGEAILVFNGRDGEFEGAIAELGKRRGVVTIGQRKRVPEPEPDLWLLFAPIKRGPLETVIQKATEIGVSHFTPIITQRTNNPAIKQERLSAIAIEAAEQCERLSVPPIGPPQKLKEVLAGWDASRQLIFCDEAGDKPTESWGGATGRAKPMLEALLPLRDAPPKPAGLLIGPEGGFSPEERDGLRACDFVTPVTLGPRILRADTAAITALALWQAALGDWRLN